jgi:glycine/D-amino acid oxidase-like deaminating enzyme
LNKKYNYIVVGQGIAGTVLAHTLLSEGKSVLIIDEGAEHSTSAIAAGLYNPVVFKRLVKSWLADELIPFMDVFYKEAEQLLGKQFYFKKQIVKLFVDEAEKAFWLKKSQEEVGIYLSKSIDTYFLNELIDNPHGSAEVVSAGNLDTRIFLSGFRNYFLQKECMLPDKFEHGDLSILEKGVSYRNNDADKLIFCEGYKTTQNPHFNWLPFKLTKGELITIKLPDTSVIPTEKVINKGVFILPLGNNTYKVGATYEWEDLSEQPTEKGKSYLIEKLKKVIQVPFEILSHQAGIRPTVLDRRPLIGLHPVHASLGIFNGMGTKGVMLAPYFAKQFSRYLDTGKALSDEVNCARFIKGQLFDKGQSKMINFE